MAELAAPGLKAIGQKVYSLSWGNDSLLFVFRSYHDPPFCSTAFPTILKLFFFVLNSSLLEISIVSSAF